MTDYTKKTFFRLGKLLHFAVTILLFFVCCKHSIIKSSSLHLETLVFIYAATMLFAFRSYSAYNVGSFRIPMLVYSQCLANIIGAGLVYTLLVINQLSFLNPVPLLLLVLTQFIWNTIWNTVCNTLYFRVYQPKNTILIYRNSVDRSRLLELFEHKRKFNVVKEIENPADDIHALIDELSDIDAVFVAGINATLRNGILKHCVEENIRCYIMPHVGDVIMMGAKQVDLFSVPVFRVMRAEANIEYLIIKRSIDIICSLLGIIVLSPFMLLTAAAVKLYDGGPCLYKQIRLTQNGRKFEILKLRSMSVNAEKDGVARLASTNDSRITPVGKVIRACRLDELPQLFNILRGDMSIVGPRPERPEIAKQYEETMPAFSLRLQVKAGLTGFAQVYGKYNTDPYDKLRMDLMYINQMSFLQDIKLIFATVKVLFMKESTSGIAEGQTTAAIPVERK